MHCVSPVHIRADNQVKNPMFGSNIEDLLVKKKKRVQIGTSTVCDSTSLKHTSHNYQPHQQEQPKRLHNEFLQCRKFKSSPLIKSEGTLNDPTHYKSRSVSPKVSHQKSASPAADKKNDKNNNIIQWQRPSSAKSAQTGHSRRLAEAKQKNARVSHSSEEAKKRVKEKSVIHLHSSRQCSESLGSMPKCTVCAEAKTKKSTTTKNMTSSISPSKRTRANICDGESMSYRLDSANTLLCSNSSSRSSSLNRSPSRSSPTYFPLTSSTPTSVRNNSGANAASSDAVATMRLIENSCHCECCPRHPPCGSGNATAQCTRCHTRRRPSSCDASAFDPNATYTMPLRSKSCESLLDMYSDRACSSSYLPLKVHSECSSIARPAASSWRATPSATGTAVSDVIVRKLADSQSCVDDIVRQMSTVKKLLFKAVHSISGSSTASSACGAPAPLKCIEHNVAHLTEQFARFEHLSDDIRTTLSDHRLIHEGGEGTGDDPLLKKINILEAENHNNKHTLLELEKRALLTGTSNDVLNLENNVLSNLKSSLEDNRAHLRRQLLAKESEVTRLNVQLRNMTRKLDRSQMECELLRQSRERAGLSALRFAAPSTASGHTNANKTSSTMLLDVKTGAAGVKLSKTHFSLEEILNDPIKTRLYVDKLNKQVKERDVVIKNLKENVLSNQQKQKLSDENASSPRETATDSNGDSDALQSNRTKLEQMHRENEKLKSVLQTHSDKLRIAESKIKHYQKAAAADAATRSAVVNGGGGGNNGERHQALSARRHKSAANCEQSNTALRETMEGEQAGTASGSVPCSGRAHSEQHSHRHRHQLQSSHHAIKRTKNFGEIELNNVRSRLQERINELEPLPELLRTTELKLFDATSRLKKHESENGELTRLVGDLKQQIDALKHNQPTSGAAASADGHKQPSRSHSNNILLNNSLASAIQAETNAKQQALIENLSNSKLEPIEQRLKMLESANSELQRQLNVKDSLIQDISSKLSQKASESSSFSRQLELALSDANVREQQFKNKLLSNERTLLAKYANLEAKLNSVQLHSTVNQRDKEDLTYDYASQVRDLKSRLEQCQTTNKQLQDYVHFLKQSYAAYFSDTSLLRCFDIPVTDGATTKNFNNNSNKETSCMTKHGKCFI